MIITDSLTHSLDKRLEVQEKVTEGLGVQMEKLIGEMEALREEVKSVEEFPPLSQVQGIYTPGQVAGSSTKRAFGSGTVPGELVSD